MTVSRGRTIFAPNPAPDAVFILETGLVRIYRLSEEGHEFTLNFVKPGEVFGEMAAFSDQPCDNFAQAIDRCIVLKVPVPAFSELLRSVPELCFSVTRQIVQRFKRVMIRTEDLVFRSVAARLADVLLMLNEDFGDELRGRRFIRVHLSQTELATLVGASRPSTNQAFKQFREQGLATFEKGHVVILDLERLRRLAHDDA
ncbi:Crp/Fnr family transcriptional regulator [Frigidibacter sp. ROC022]|uniref:Crp/Fnr family transcriptional regulator n=1 Tax=Frigidibacter sp. ROC022 TaxID=2971796 RepID=UPI00215A15CC|nr:Crp/Fnr family transcriptional regulator [Frigidibacter sp. ROC022]MCR8722701.1 Crp/Fnr family transcriptional regulator [Frigidibacter sp. ROC022]